MSLFRRRSAVAELPRPSGEREQRLVWRIAALLLDYPTADFVALLPQLAAAAPTGPLAEFVDIVTGRDQLELAREYVETFDTQRKTSLHLTYYAYGDTRKRGMALLRFKHAYKAAGEEFGDHELPDYLPALLEFAATVDYAGGKRLLGENVPVIELLRLALIDVGSPYAMLIDAVLGTLPPLTVADRRRIKELAAQGPPDEDVGLDTFFLDPRLSHHEEAAANEQACSDSRQPLPTPKFGPPTQGDQA